MTHEPRARGGVRRRDRLRPRRHDPRAARPRLRRHGRLYAHQRRRRRAQHRAVHVGAVSRCQYRSSTSSLLLTNKTPVGTYRGPGRFETDFFRERLLDMAARDLGIDQVEFRRRNLVREAEMPYKVATIAPFESKDELDSGDYQVTLDRCLAEFGWAEKEKLKGKLIDGRYHGLAVVLLHRRRRRRARRKARGWCWKPTARSRSISARPASARGWRRRSRRSPPTPWTCRWTASISVFHGSTAYVSDGYGSYHSRSIVMGGSAVLDAATKLRAGHERGSGAAAQLRRGRSGARRRPRRRARRQIGVVGGAGAGAAVGRRRVLQPQAHLGLRRARRPCRGRSENRRTSRSSIMWPSRIAAA